MDKEKEVFRKKIILGILVVFLVAYLSVVYIPKWQLGNYYITVKKDTKESVELENKLRQSVIQVCGGLLVLFGLYLTYRRIRASEKQADAFKEGQITERFTRAIDQLGSVDKDGNKNLEIRIGGIYALERIARDSKKDHIPVMEVLTAYVRENAPYKQEAPILIKDTPDLPVDIQAILTVIGRRELAHEEGTDYHLNLAETNLGKARFMKAKLQEASFFAANLKMARFWEADLQGASFWRADLQGAFFSKADLQWANMSLTEGD